MVYLAWGGVPGPGDGGVPGPGGGGVPGPRGGGVYLVQGDVPGPGGRGGGGVRYPPCEQNDKQVQKYYLAPNFVCGL